MKLATRLQVEDPVEWTPDDGHGFVLLRFPDPPGVPDDPLDDPRAGIAAADRWMVGLYES